jgi:hypothetical protein
VGAVKVQEGEAGEVGLPACGLVKGGMHGSAEVVTGEQIHAPVADNRGGGELVEHPLQGRSGRPALAGSAGGSHAGGSAVSSMGEVEQVGPFGVVEL